MLFLSFETSCDDTCVAVVENGQEILSNVVASQNALHAPFGGVFPELAARAHVKNLLPVMQAALDDARLSITEIGAFAATQGPGLINSLLVGLGAAKTLATLHQKPFYGVNHIEAHLYPGLLQNAPLPALGLILSGGHTTMVLIEKFGSYKHVGSTVDDAIGEAFDKVARLLESTEEKSLTSLPSGQWIEELAKNGNPNAYAFRAGEVKKNPYAFSFSGLKTAVSYQIPKNAPLALQEKRDIAAAFQKAAFTDVLQKIERAKKMYHPKSIVLGGGVVQNQTLQYLCQSHASLPCFFPERGLASDNGAMIGMLAWHKAQQGPPDSLALGAASRLPFFLV